VGCAILPKEGFSDQELIACSERIDPSTDSNLSYYPLLRPGERFPVNDPLKQPNLIPRPEDRALYLHGILEAIARVEKQGFDALEELGATPITEVFHFNDVIFHIISLTYFNIRLGFHCRRRIEERHVDENALSHPAEKDHVSLSNP
jgi:hypothetical protein